MRRRNTSNLLLRNPIGREKLTRLRCETLEPRYLLALTVLSDSLISDTQWQASESADRFVERSPEGNADDASPFDVSNETGCPWTYVRIAEKPAVCSSDPLQDDLEFGDFLVDDIGLVQDAKVSAQGVDRISDDLQEGQTGEDDSGAQADHLDLDEETRETCEGNDGKLDKDLVDHAHLDFPEFLPGAESNTSGADSLASMTVPAGQEMSADSQGAADGLQHVGPSSMSPDNRVSNGLQLQDNSSSEPSSALGVTNVIGSRIDEPRGLPGLAIKIADGRHGAFASNPTASWPGLDVDSSTRSEFDYFQARRSVVSTSSYDVSASLPLRDDFTVFLVAGVPNASVRQDGFVPHDAGNSPAEEAALSRDRSAMNLVARRETSQVYRRVDRSARSKSSGLVAETQGVERTTTGTSNDVNLLPPLTVRQGELSQRELLEIARLDASNATLKTPHATREVVLGEEHPSTDVRASLNADQPVRFGPFGWLRVVAATTAMQIVFRVRTRRTNFSPVAGTTSLD